MKNLYCNECWPVWSLKTTSAFGTKSWLWFKEPYSDSEKETRDSLEYLSSSFTSLYLITVATDTRFQFKPLKEVLMTKPGTRVLIGHLNQQLMLLFFLWEQYLFKPEERNTSPIWLDARVMQWDMSFWSGGTDPDSFVSNDLSTWESKKDPLHITVFDFAEFPNFCVRFDTKFRFYRNLTSFSWSFEPHVGVSFSKWRDRKSVV